MKVCSKESILDKGIACMSNQRMRTVRKNPRSKENKFQIKSNQDKLLPSLRTSRLHRILRYTPTGPFFVRLLFRRDDRSALEFSGCISCGGIVQF